MTNENIYSTFKFKDKNTGQLLYQLMLRNIANQPERIRRALQELTEKFSLPESEIVIEGKKI